MRENFKRLFENFKRLRENFKRLRKFSCQLKKKKALDSVSRKFLMKITVIKEGKTKNNIRDLLILLKNNRMMYQ